MGAGQSAANNAASQSMQINNSILQNYINSCGTTVDGNTTFAANNCGNFEANNVNIYTTAIFDQTCVQNISSNTQMQNNLTQAATQNANALAKGFGLESAEASQFANQMIQLSNQVQQNFTQSCAGELQQNVAFDCTNTNNFVLDNVTIDTNVRSAVNCQQAITAQSEFVNQISQTLSQTATAQSIGTSFDAILAFLIVLCIAACFIMYYGEQFLVYLIIIVVVLAILAIIGYIVYAKVEKKYPFQGPSNN